MKISFVDSLGQTFRPDWIPLADLIEILRLIETSVKALLPRVKPDGVFARFISEVFAGKYSEALYLRVFHYYYAIHSHGAGNGALLHKNRRVMDISESIRLLADMYAPDYYSSGDSPRTDLAYIKECLKRSLGDEACFS
jgi:hypothetical protein